MRISDTGVLDTAPWLIFGQVDFRARIIQGAGRDAQGVANAPSDRHGTTERPSLAPISD
jgi:hypothetical protein